MLSTLKGFVNSSRINKAVTINQLLEAFTIRNKLRGFIIGCIAASTLLFTTSTYSATVLQTIKVTFSKVNLVIDGGTTKADTLTFNGKKYILLTTACDLFNKNFTIDKKTGTVTINSKDSINEQDNSNSSVLEKTNIKPTPSTTTKAAVPAETKTLIEQSTHGKGIFKGYFRNTDYNNPAIFITPGEQTAADQTIKNIAAKFNNKKDATTIQEIFTWMNHNLVYGDGEKFSRTSCDIIGKKMFTGCTDMGLAFIALSRAKGIPSVFIQTGRIDWIEKVVKDSADKGMITGHILVEVQLSDKKWYLVDSTAGKLYLDYDRNNMSLPDGYYIFSKSIEVFDSGVKNEQSNYDIMLKLFEGFDLTKYNNPKYDYIDLLSGSKMKSYEFKGNSLVIGTGAIILGAKESVEAFYGKYFNGVTCKLSGEQVIKEGELTSGPYLIDLHIKGDKFPDYLKNYLSDIDKDVKSGTIYKYSIGGQKRILIIGDSLESLVKVVNSLPEDFLTAN